jgi:hypothetical protein
MAPRALKTKNTARPAVTPAARTTRRGRMAR